MGPGKPQKSINQPTKDTVKPVKLGVTERASSKPNKDKELYQVVFMNDLDEVKLRLRRDLVVEPE